MTQISEEPSRLLDDPDLGELLRNDLQIARTQGAAAGYSVEAGLARFEASLEGAAAVPGGSLGGLRVLRWFAGTTAIVGVGALALWLLGGEPGAGASTANDEIAVNDALVAAAPRAATPEPETKVEQPSAVPTIADDAETEVVAPEPIDEAGEPAIAKPEPTAKPKPEPTPAVDEITLISDARKSLAGDPAKTLALTETAEKDFPNGTMIQERRGYAILALVALDRHDEANTRAQDYLQRWPKGSLSRRVREAVGME